MKYIDITADRNRNLIIGDYRVFAGEQYNCLFRIDDRFSGDDTPDYYILKFETVPFGKKFSTGRINGESSPARVVGGRILCPLTGEMTCTGRLKIQLEAHSVDGDDCEVIEKTSIATLDFGCSLNSSFTASFTGLSPLAEIEKLDRRIRALEDGPEDAGYLAAVCAAQMLYVDDGQTPLIFADSIDEAEGILTEMIDNYDYENCRYILAAVRTQGIHKACLIKVSLVNGSFDIRRYAGTALLELLKESVNG